MSATGMGATEEPNEASRRVEREFARFLEARDVDPGLDFERWLAEHPGDETALRRLFAAWTLIDDQLGGADRDAASRAGGSDRGGLESSLEAGHEILSELGVGAFGRVYRARDRRLKRDVALKVLDDAVVREPGMRGHFLEEARVLARLDHPNIVRVHSVESHEGEIRISLELLEGRTLQAIVQEDGPLSATEAAQIGADLCRALAAIHGAGLVHMDVKPGNVMRAAKGRIVLLDFGFAREATEDRGQRGEAEGPIGGTPLFMSPEHFEAASIGPRADLYSLGVLLYWLVAGRYPFEASGFDELREAVVAGRATPLLDLRPDVPPAFAAVVERAMMPRPEDRFASAGEMEVALRRFLSGAPGGSPSTDGPRRRTLAVAVTLVSLVAGLLWVARGSGAAPPFDLQASFYESVEGEEGRLLEQGARVRLRSRLYLDVECERPFHLYVFNQDDEGRWFQLFPAEDGALLPAGAHRLPGAERHWIVDTRAGEEHLFVLASPEPVPLAETLTKLIPRPTSGEGLDPHALTRGERRSVLRGIGVESSADPEAEVPDLPPLVELFAELERTRTPDERVHYRHLTLRHE